MLIYRLSGVALLLFACATMLLSGCSTTTSHAPPNISTFATTLPPLPSGKLTSAPTGSFIEGSAYYDKQTNAVVTASDMQLGFLASELSWGMWQIVPGSGSLISVEVQLSVEPGHEAYVAIADYARGSWALHGPITTSTLYMLNESENLSSSGNAYLAVITSDGDDALVDRLSVTIERSGWQTISIDNDGNVGEYTSLVVVDGNPAISYLDDTNNDLKYVRSTTPTGVSASDWGTPLILDSEGTKGYYTSMAVVDGNPAISYTDLSDFDLLYIRSTTSTGMDIADWSQRVIVEDTGVPGYYSSLAVVGDKPAISHWDQTSRELKYARSTTPTGASAADWSMKATVDSSADVGGFCSLAVVEDNPAIAYYDATNTSVKYARSTTASGALDAHWSQVVTVADAVNGGQYISMAIVDGNPAISYYNTADLDVMYMRSSTSIGASALDWSQRVTVHAAGVVGAYNSLAVIDGNPAISYYDITNKSLRYIRSTTAMGENTAAWLQVPATVDSSEDGSGKYTSLTTVDGKPAISYFDDTLNELKYAILYE